MAAHERVAARRAELATLAGVFELACQLLVSSRGLQ